MIVPEHLGWTICGDPLGTGGQGTVYRAFHRDAPGIARALKVLNSDARPEAKERFLNEMATLSRLSHPNIIKVLDYSKHEDDFQYLVMEFHEGAKTVAETCLVPTENNPYHGNTLKCLDLFEQIIHAIRACELSRDTIYHRDISPKNILILPDESIRLIDFGLCFTVNQTTLTMTGDNIGTRSYAAPECGAHSQYKIGTHTDIYSAAKVLWSTITSKRVFDEHFVEEHTSMQSMLPNIEVAWHLETLLNGCIQKDPADRFGRTETVLYYINEARRVANGGFPPVEKAFYRCPSCGLGGVQPASNPHHLFGHIPSSKFNMSECKKCGFIVIRRNKPLA
ncbi:MAG: serine/threonine protein kinase [Caldilineaceae bacterium SB0675_bin_29]|uniref:non-specific serine/threonine protein kinase n=1 Tax=Caldilineaceae bacterium SB0675_bin_29 TaxID=2605266 RepID=A0A6B1FW35_9CHLR|nr:serine/threonine protein kinase [Caldilineaceae bacterium SB0675_bin_29]